MLAKHGQRASPIRHLRCRHPYRMRQSLRIDGDVAFDTRHLLAGVIPFVLGRIGIFHALRIDNAKRRFVCPTTAQPFFADHIFLKRLQEDWGLQTRLSYSIAENTQGLCAMGQNPQATSAMDRHSSSHTTQHKKCRTNHACADASCAWRYRASFQFAQTVLA